MNENNALKPELLTLTDELVASYLNENPEFFNRNSSLIASLKVTDPQRGVVSLVERQQQVLRQKVNQLEEEITQLMTVANHNENLFAVYSDLYLALLDCTSLDALLTRLDQTVTELLSLSGIRLWLTPSYAIESASPCVVTNDLADMMHNRLSKEDYYFGRLKQQEQSDLFGEPKAGSVVLVKLVYGEKELGLLAIGSEDIDHFDPRMDTLLLSQFRKIVAKLISQFLPE